MTTWFINSLNMLWDQSDLDQEESIPFYWQDNLYCSDIGGWHHIPTDRYPQFPSEITTWPDGTLIMPEPALERNEMPRPNAATATIVERNPAAALVNIEIKREDGVLQLIINAQPLHELLDSVGARRASGGFADPPPCNFSTIATNSNRISPKLFLQREYPVKVALNQHYNIPPTMAQLRTLAESGHEAVRTILAHYQPVEISYTIQKKLAS